MGLINLLKDIKDIRRFEQILHALIKHELGFVVDRLKLRAYLPLPKIMDKEKYIERETQPQRIRMVLEDLGGAFIKLGQLLSLRPDLIPQEYCDELAKLQDKVPPFPTEKAREIVELELGRPIEKVFAYFSERPIAAASVSQVHEAVLKNGTKVVVKVQRPGIRKVFQTDIDILSFFARRIEAQYKPEIINPIDIVKEFESYTESELDFERERRNVERFYERYLQDKAVTIPKAYKESSTSRVLTLRHIQGPTAGEVIRHPEGFDRKGVASAITNAMFKQVFLFGFFHADPHPGNILVLKRNRIVFLDFGIVGSISDTLREKTQNLFIAMIQADADAMADAIIDMGIAETRVDRERLRDDLKLNLSQYYGTAIKRINISVLFFSLLTLAKRNRIRLPANFVLLGKAIITIEGIARSLNPDFDFVTEAQPFVRKLVEKKASPQYLLHRIGRFSSRLKSFIYDFPDKSSEIIDAINSTEKDVRNLHDDMQTLTTEMDRSSNRIAFGLIITGFVIAAAVLYLIEQPLLFGMPVFSLVLGAIAVIAFLVLVGSMLRERLR